jgi:hypothetical protein
MFDPAVLIERAKSSKRHLRLLNFALKRKIPFNKPHGLDVVALGDRSVKILIPYKRKNFNHIKGLHACGLATISEYATGMVLLNTLNPKEYRIIMQRMELDYHYQGKMDAYASFSIDDDWLNSQVLEPLSTKDSVVIKCEVKIHDQQNNHLTTGNIYWQVKNWKKVKTKA